MARTPLTEHGLLAPGDLQALTNAAAAVDCGLLVVTCPDVSSAYTAALAAARHDAGSSWARRAGETAVDLDVHPAAPAGPQWTVAEVEELIVSPSRFRPIDRAHVVVRDAHAMAPIARDRLLKLIEEPRSDILYWFIVPALEQVAPTLRSRAQRVIAVQSADVRHQWDHLLSTGLTPAQIDQVLADAAGDPRLIAAATDQEVAAAVHTLAQLRQHVLNGTCQTPTTTAGDSVAALAAIARTLTGARSRGAHNEPRAAWEALTPAARNEGRALLRQALAQTSEELARRIPALEDAPAVLVAERTLSACREAVGQCEMNTHPITVLAALLAVSARG